MDEPPQGRHRAGDGDNNGIRPCLLLAIALTVALATGCGQSDSNDSWTEHESRQTSFALRLLARDYAETRVAGIAEEVASQIENQDFELGKGIVPVGAHFIRDPDGRVVLIGLYWLANDFDVYHFLLSCGSEEQIVPVSDQLRNINIEEAMEGSRLFSIELRLRGLAGVNEELLDCMSTDLLNVELLGREKERLHQFDSAEQLQLRSR